MEKTLRDVNYRNNTKLLNKLEVDDAVNATLTDTEPGRLVIDEAVNVQIGSNNIFAVNEDICW